MLSTGINCGGHFINGITLFIFQIILWEEIYLDNLSMGSQLIVVHYENAKDDPGTEMKRIFEAIELEIDPRRLDCFVRDTRQKHKRNPRTYANPYTKELTEKFLAAIEKVQGMLAKRGLEAMPTHKYKWMPQQ